MEIHDVCGGGGGEGIIEVCVWFSHKVYTKKNTVEICTTVATQTEATTLLQFIKKKRGFDVVIVDRARRVVYSC